MATRNSPAATGLARARPGPRVELATDLASAAGVTLYADVPYLPGLVVEREVDGDHTLAVTVDARWEGAAELRAPNVLVVVRSDRDHGDDFEEYRVEEVRERRTEGGGVFVVLARAPIRDYGKPGLCREFAGTGVQVTDLGLVNMAAASYLARWATPRLPAHLAVGQVDNTTPLTTRFTDKTPLALATHLRDEIRNTGDQCERRLRRVARAGYALDLVREVGAGAATPELVLGVHVDHLETVARAAAQVTEAEARDGAGRGLAYAVWEVEDVDGATVVLRDPTGGAPPVGFDDQLNGFAIRDNAGAFLTITDSDAATQALTLAAPVAALAPGDLVEVFADATGRRVSTLTHPLGARPIAQGGYGPVYGLFTRAGVDGLANLARNAFCDEWTGGALGAGSLAGVTILNPYDATTAPGGTGLELVTGAYTPQYGDGTARFIVRTSSWGEQTVSLVAGGFATMRLGTPFARGWLTPWLAPTSGDDRITVTIRVHIVSGEVFSALDPGRKLGLRLQGFDAAGAAIPGAVVDGIHTAEAYALVTVAGSLIDFTFADVRVTQACRVGLTLSAVSGKTTTPIPGGVQITENAWAPTGTAVHVDAVVIERGGAFTGYRKGSGACRLWQATNGELAASWQPPVEVSATLRDLAARDPAWAHAAVTLGAKTRVRTRAGHPAPVDLTPRVIALREVIDDPEASSITWSTRPRTLTQAVALAS